MGENRIRGVPIYLLLHRLSGNAWPGKIFSFQAVAWCGRCFPNPKSSSILKHVSQDFMSYKMYVAVSFYCSHAITLHLYQYGAIFQYLFLLSIESGCYIMLGNLRWKKNAVRESGSIWLYQRKFWWSWKSIVLIRFEQWSVISIATQFINCIYYTCN